MSGHYKGIVVEVGVATVRVRIPELDNLVTDWLPVLQTLTLGARCFQVPRRDSQVVVLPGQGLEDGVVVGCLYSQVDPAPFSDPLVLGFEADDGSVFAYDPSTGRLRISSPRAMDIEVERLRITGDVEQIGSLTVTGEATISESLTVARATVGGVPFGSHGHISANPGSKTGPAIP